MADDAGVTKGDVAGLNGGRPEPEVTSQPPVSVLDVLKSTKLDDAAKFGVFHGLVEAGKLTNKEVVNSVLHLVRRRDGVTQNVER
jgi:hypothetical protein